MTDEEKTGFVVGVICGIIMMIIIGLFRLGPWCKSMDGKILTDTETGTVYRVTKLGIAKDSRVMFEEQELIQINNSTYEQKWNVVRR